VKVLLARTDRLGDLVLTLPVFAWLKASRPDWELHALVAPAARPLVEADPHLAAVHVWDGDVKALDRLLAAQRYDAAALLLYRHDVARALRRAGVPVRVGPLSRLGSWFTLNRGVRQRRSRAVRHERDYNLELAARLLDGSVDEPAAWPEPRIHLAPELREAGRRFRAASAPGAATVALIHPGMGGSALNWAPERFAAVAAELAARPGWRVFVTGGEGDRPVSAAVAAAAGGVVEDLTGRFGLSDFLGVLAAADVLVAPSTGPLHMAAALDVPVVGVYPPLPVQSIVRWGPRGDRARALAPGSRCPARLRCRGERCPFWNCMDEVPVEAVVAAVLAAVNDTETPPPAPGGRMEER